MVRRSRSLLKQLIVTFIIFISSQCILLSFSLDSSPQVSDVDQSLFFHQPDAHPLTCSTSQQHTNVDIDWSNYYPRRIQTKQSLPIRDDEAYENTQPSEGPRVIHKCTCLSKDGNEQKDTTTPVNILDIPGASLFIPHWNRGFAKLHVDYNITRGEFFDVDIKQRYPMELYAKDISTIIPTTNLGNFAGIAAVFPEPMERLVTMYDHVEENNNIRSMHRVCRRWDLRCYAARPGVANAMTKIMLGIPRFDDSIEWKETLLEQAVQNLKRLSFVAVEEEWNEAVCQFHNKFGGIPHQGAFRPNNYRMEPVDILNELRETFQPDLDGRLYEAAKAEFYNRFLSEGNGKRCYEQIEVLPSASECWPRSCQELGKQCGEWPDGCGKVLVCGQCPQGRSGLPETWKAECSSDGQCIPTCPWWVENGIWFRGGSDLAHQLRLLGAPYYLNMAGFEQLHHLMPSHAISMCVEGCRRQNEGTKSTFIETFCFCGESVDSAQILNLTAAFLQERMGFIRRTTLDVDPIASSGSALLRKVQTQPKCCNNKVNTPPDSLWKEGSVEAEYFAAYDMGCGKHFECANLGRKQSAHVVVFSESTRVCYLGRHVPPTARIFNGNTFRGTQKVHRMLNADFNFIRTILNNEG